MSQSEITILREEIAKLREEIAVLRDSANKHFDLFTTHIADQGTDISDLFSYVMPVLHKVYPGFTAGKTQYDQVLKRSQKPDGGDPDKESG